MAQAFRPSRSVMYGAPEQEAMLDVSAELSGRFRNWSQEQIQAEYLRQNSNGTIAIQAERHGLAKFMAENTNDPGAWPKYLEDNEERIRRAVMDPVSQPQAKQALELELKMFFAQSKAWMEEAGAKQSAKNTNVNFETQYDSILTDSVEYQDINHAMASVMSAHQFIEKNFNQGKLPVDRLSTRAAAEAAKRDLTRHIISDFLFQEAMRLGDESIIDQANEIAPRSMFDDQTDKPMFGPDEIGEIKERYRAASNAAKRQAREEESERVAQNDREYTARVLMGEITDPTIITNAMLAGDISEEMGKWAHNRLTSLVPPDDKRLRLRAYRDMRDAIDAVAAGEMTPKAAAGKYYQNEPELSEEDAESFYDELKSLPRRSLVQWRTEGLKKSDEIMDAPLLAVDFIKAGLKEQDIEEAKGRIAKRLDQWAKETFTEDKPLDRNKFMEGMLAITLQVRDELLAPKAPEPKKSKRQRRITAPWTPPEPQSRAEFENTVTNLQDKTQALEYYNKYKDRF